MPQITPTSDEMAHDTTLALAPVYVTLLATAATAACAVLPEVLQLVADNSGLIPWLDDGYKSGIRLACMVLAIVLRPVKQKSVSGGAP